MNPIPDRLKEYPLQTRATGIDFIYVDPANQTNLFVHFLLKPDSINPDMTAGPQALTDTSKVRIYSPAGEAADKPITGLNWSNNVLQIKVAVPGDFTIYRLFIDDSRMDPFYNDVSFDFKAACPSDLDCKPPDHECPPENWVDFPVDYLARDFFSYKQALLEFASQRYPHWPDRLEADAGVMFVELMSAVGDEMAYYQDRIAREGYLETATQRRSLRRHGRLVDYNLHDGLASFAWIVVLVNNNTTGDIPAGTATYATGQQSQVRFEIGYGLKEAIAGKNYKVKSELNKLDPHIWDEDRACLETGSTEIYIEGEFELILQFDDFPENGKPGKWIILQTKPLNASQPARTHLVRVTSVKNAVDPVLNKKLTRLNWEKEHATLFELDLTVLTLFANVLPATAGETKIDYFITGGDYTEFSNAEHQTLHDLNAHIDPEFAIERKGRKVSDQQGRPEDSLIYFHTLPGTETQNIAFIGSDPSHSLPEVYLEEITFDGAAWQKVKPWNYIPSFVGIQSADPEDPCFSLEDGAWRRVAGYQRPVQEIIHRDYASNRGYTLRFGDKEFGKVPDHRSVFRVKYRLNNGKWDNVSSDTIAKIETVPGLDLTITNPLPADSGMDPETPEELRQLAPEAFSRITYRAVRPEDYAEAAERLPWIQRAGAEFRWTGSWLTVFATPDPVGSVSLEEEKEFMLLDHLNRFRQAGREVYVRKPEYADLDIEIEICAAPDAYRGEVKQRVLEILLGKKGIFPRPGFFSADRFTFGTPLHRSVLEAVIQSLPGVRTVEEIRIGRRGWFDMKVFDQFDYDPGPKTIIRVENDPLHPWRGSLNIYIHGGA